MKRYNLKELEKMSPKQLTENNYLKIVHNEYGNVYVGYIKQYKYRKAFRYANSHLNYLKELSRTHKINMADILASQQRVPYAVAASIVMSLTL